jgi:osmoprotectant transport system substrate-binding protein
MLEKNGFQVQDKTRTGATDVVRKALVSGEIDVYPEYTANGILLFHKNAKVDPSVLKNAEETYNTAKSLDASAGIVWLKQAPANNTWGVALPKALADANKLKTMDEWAAYINAGKPVKVVGSQEFFASPVAMPAFEKAYGFSLNKDQIVALATGDTSVTEKAAADGTNGANAAMAYGTDATIAPLNLVLLEDDKHAQPFYQPAPTFRKAVTDKYPEIARMLDPVFAKLDRETLQKLNGQVQIDGQPPKTVAVNWLTQAGFIK